AAPPHPHQLRGRGGRGHGGRPRRPRLRSHRRPLSPLLRRRSAAAPAREPPRRDRAREAGGADGDGGGVPREVLKQVRLIELRTRGWVNTVFSGEYLSVFRGQGMEFSEVRAYQDGDDVRTIDSNVTARMGHPYVKKHVEERE